MKIRSKFAVLIIEDEDGKRHIIDRVDLQQDSRVVCNFGKWFTNDNPGEQEDLHSSEAIREEFRLWLDPGSGETFWGDD